jgi:hypothetical protein
MRHDEEITPELRPRPLMAAPSRCWVNSPGISHEFAVCHEAPAWTVHARGFKDRDTCSEHLAGTIRWLLARSSDWQAFVQAVS